MGSQRVGHDWVTQYAHGAYVRRLHSTHFDKGRLSNPHRGRGCVSPGSARALSLLRGSAPLCAFSTVRRPLGPEPSLPVAAVAPAAAHTCVCSARGCSVIRPWFIWQVLCCGVSLSNRIPTWGQWATIKVWAWPPPFRRLLSGPTAFSIFWRLPASLPRGPFLHLQSQPLSLSCSPYPCVYTGYPGMIQDHLCSSESLIWSHLQSPRPCKVRCSQILEIRMWTSLEERE